MNKKMSLSELSFIVLTDNYNVFIEYEEEAIGKRENNVENYLIRPNPNGQYL